MAGGFGINYGNGTYCGRGLAIYTSNDLVIWTNRKSSQPSIWRV
jgi:hypothetical protein